VNGPNAHLDVTQQCVACTAVKQGCLTVDLSGESQPLCQRHWNMLLVRQFGDVSQDVQP